MSGKFRASNLKSDHSSLTMASVPHSDTNEPLEDEDAPALLDASEAAEEIAANGDQDHPMESDPDEPVEESIQLQNDSVAHFDSHSDSVFSIAQHPTNPSLIATGGGDDSTFIWSSDPPSRPLPASFQSGPSPGRESLQPIARLTGHTDSVNTLTFTLPSGAYLLTGGLDGQLRAHATTSPDYPLIASASEVPEINFLSPCPNPAYPDTVALGASDGSVWIYSVSATDKDAPLQVLQAYYMHTASCTAGAWTPDGNLLATISEDGSFYVWDPFGAASAAGLVSSAASQAVVGLTVEDQRFAVPGGLYSIAIAPSGAFAVVGGAAGMLRVVGLPRLCTAAATGSAAQGLKKGVAAKNKAGEGKKIGGQDKAGFGQAGQVLASLQVQEDGIETLSISAPPLTLLAAGSVDGSIVLFDHAHRFAVRRHIKDAHEEFAVVKVEFLNSANGNGHILTSCGMDGVVRRWDSRGGTTALGQGLIGEYRGHRGDGEGGGVLGFLQGGNGERIVTAGDDGVGLVFDAKI